MKIVMKKLKHLTTLLLSKFGVVIVLAFVWQFSAWLIASQDFPSLLAVLKSLQFHLNEGEMFSNIFITLRRVLLSFIIAMLLGGVIGIIMGVNAWVNKLTDTLFIILPVSYTHLTLPTTPYV